MQKLTAEELRTRRVKFSKMMTKYHENWETALIISKVNQYYFTGTMQDALLVIKRGGGFHYFVRRSYERALDESPIPDHISEMNSYRDAAEKIGNDFGETYFEAETVPYAVMERIRRYFNISVLGSLEDIVMNVRAVKSEYELSLMEIAGQRHHSLLLNEVPGLLVEGISEAEFVGALQYKMMQYDYQGITRFYRFGVELTCGQVGFGVNSLYPTSFDGPGGALGVGAATPVAGRHDRKLKKGDLVFVDNGFGYGGYHSDHTQVYMFGAEPSDEVKRAHEGCMEIESYVASRLKVGEIPSEIYRDTMKMLPEYMKRDFMGFKERTVKFLGHGVGLHVDEMPVIAEGFDSPLEENMTIALELKRGIPEVGMVGVEDTYVVTPTGGRCLTGGGRDIIVVQ